MIARGHVQNGVVVLDGGVRLPEGQEVTVLTVLAPPAQGLRPHSLLDVPPVSLGRLLHVLTSDDDLLGEMLEGRS